MKIDNSSQDPIYLQIAMQLKDDILKGRLEEGMMLPSIRGLAKDLRISVITTMKAYEVLSEEGLIQSIPGKGYYVNHLDSGMVMEQYQRRIEKSLLNAMHDAKIAGIKQSELVDMLIALQQMEETL